MTIRKLQEDINQAWNGEVLELHRAASRSGATRNALLGDLGVGLSQGVDTKSLVVSKILGILRPSSDR